MGGNTNFNHKNDLFWKKSGYSIEKEFCMTRLDWVKDSTQSAWNVCKTLKNVCYRRKNVVLNENSVEGKPCINREINSLELTI